jgi:UDP-N-acetylmuramate--alanine ligase
MLPQNIYMVGIGGIGMSALAQLLARTGRRVEGSDREESPTTELLVSKGITVSIGHSAAVPPDADLLIYSDAVWADNPERMRAKELKIREMSYFEALAAATAHGRTLAVTGTHGKTTTTGMLAAILKAGGYEPTAIVGSIVKDFGSNYLPGSDELFVVEACEYRDHVLKLTPEILVITNIEWDHTDYFPDVEALIETMRKAARAVPEHGYIICNPAGAHVAHALAGARAKIIDYTQEPAPEIALLGDFNKENARAAAAAARAAFRDIKQGTMDRALMDFKGSWRRFEYKGETPQGALVYDDYAHHPTAIKKTLEAARAKFPGKKIVIAFHPHLYSRTKSLMNEFAEALCGADAAYVAPIYPAREAPDPEVTNEILSARAREKGGTVSAASFDEIRHAFLGEPSGTLLITMGAGDIYKVADQIAE